jgi:type II secretory pathway pseudopilin PulG
MTARLAGGKGFTVLEVAIVLTMVSVLVLFAAPRFLGQEERAQSLEGKAYLNYGWKAARGGALSYNGEYGEAEDVLDAIRASETGFTSALGGSCLDVDKADLIVDEVRSHAEKIFLYARASNGVIWRLTATPLGQPEITRACLQGGKRAPINLNPPSLIGEPRAGGTLRIDIGEWNVPVDTVVTWYECDPFGSNTCRAIPGAHGLSYDVPEGSGPVTPVIAAFHAGTNPTPDMIVPPAWGEFYGGNDEQTSFSFPIVHEEESPGVYLYQASEGSLGFEVGDTLSFSDGVWLTWDPINDWQYEPLDPTPPSPSENVMQNGWEMSYQWFRCENENAQCDPIEGADESTYTLSESDLGAVVVAGLVVSIDDSSPAVTTITSVGVAACTSSNDRNGSGNGNNGRSGVSNDQNGDGQGNNGRCGLVFPPGRNR